MPAQLRECDRVTPTKIRSRRERPGRVLTLAALTLASSWWAGVAAAEHPLSQEEAITRALAKNESIVVDRAALDAAESAVTGAKGAYDPLLEVNGGWYRLAEPVNSSFSGAPPGEDGTTVQGFDVSATVTQLFPTGGTAQLRTTNSREETNSTFSLLTPAYNSKLGGEFRQPLLRNRAVDPARRTLRVAAADRDQASATLARTVADTVAAVERAYWTLVAARREVGVREDSVRLAEEQLGETRSRVEGGVAPETEAAQPRAELERRRGELLTSREAVARAENDVKLLILGDSDEPLWTDELVPVEELAIPVVPTDLPGALAQALARRPELEIAGAALTRRRVESEFARNGVRPSLDAVVSYDRFGLAGTGNPASSPPPGSSSTTIPPGLEGGLGQALANLAERDRADARVGVVLGIPIGNRAARAEAARAESFERQAEAEIGRARKAIRVEVLDAAAALETASQRIDAARAGREAAEVQLTAEQDRFGVGMSTNFLVLTRQNDLARARLDEISALTAYRRARTEMARATGSLLEERGIVVDRTDRTDR